MQDLFVPTQNCALIHHFVFHYSILPKKNLKYNTFRANRNRTALNFGKLNEIGSCGRFDNTTLLNPPSEGGDKIEPSNRDFALFSHSPLSLCKKKKARKECPDSYRE